MNSSILVLLAIFCGACFGLAVVILDKARRRMYEGFLRIEALLNAAEGDIRSEINELREVLVRVEDSLIKGGAE